MPGQPRVTKANTAAKKAHVLELIAKGHSFTGACRLAEVSDRTFRNWRQRDEAFTLAVDRAEREGADRLVDWMVDSIFDPNTPEREKTLRAFFRIKKVYPEYRENHKVEHVVSGGLQSALKKLAKLGSDDG